MPKYKIIFKLENSGDSNHVKEPKKTLESKVFDFPNSVQKGDYLIYSEGMNKWENQEITHVEHYIYKGYSNLIMERRNRDDYPDDAEKEWADYQRKYKKILEKICKMVK